MTEPHAVTRDPVMGSTAPGWGLVNLSAQSGDLLEHLHACLLRLG